MPNPSAEEAGGSGVQNAETLVWMTYRLGTEIDPTDTVYLILEFGSNTSSCITCIYKFSTSFSSPTPRLEQFIRLIPPLARIGRETERDG